MGTLHSVNFRRDLLDHQMCTEVTVPSWYNWGGGGEWEGIESLLIFVVDKVFGYIKSSDRNEADLVWSLKRTLSFPNPC